MAKPTSSKHPAPNPQKIEPPSRISDLDALLLSNHVYTPGNSALPTEWTTSSKFDSDILCKIPKDEFYAKTYINSVDNKIVIAFRGTNSFTGPDMRSNATSAARNVVGAYKCPDEYEKYVKRYVNEIRKRYPDRKIEFVGHSRGAFFAELCAIEYGAYATGFESPGALDIAETIFTKAQIKNREHFVRNLIAGKNICNSAFGRHINGVYYCPQVDEFGKDRTGLVDLLFYGGIVAVTGGLVWLAFSQMLNLNQSQPQSFSSKTLLYILLALGLAGVLYGYVHMDVKHTLKEWQNALNKCPDMFKQPIHLSEEEWRGQSKTAQALLFGVVLGVVLAAMTGLFAYASPRAMFSPARSSDTQSPEESEENKKHREQRKHMKSSMASTA